MRATASGVWATRPALPLGLTLGLHLLLVMLWLSRSTAPLPDGASARLTLLVPILAPPPPRVQPAPQEREPVRVPAAAARAIVVPAPPVPEPEPEPAARATDPLSDAPSPPSASVDGDLATRARRAAGAIDRELRGGKPGVLTDADTPWTRLRRATEEAHAAPVFAAETRDSYTSPDGVIIYRARQGKRQTCRQTGSVNFLPGGARSANSAGDLPCPKGAQWDRY